MKEHLRTRVIKQKSFVDMETQEIIAEDIKTEQYVAGSAEEFALIYASFWNIVMNANLSKVALILLMGLIRDYANGQSFTIGKTLRKDLSKLTGLSEKSFVNSTKYLLQSNLIYRLEGTSREYKLNHRLIFKGSSTKRKKFMLEMWDYCPNC